MAGRLRMTAPASSRAPEPPPGLPSHWQREVDRVAGLLVLAAAGKTDREFELLAFDFFSAFNDALCSAGFERFADWALDTVAQSVDRQRDLLKAANRGQPGCA